MKIYTNTLFEGHYPIGTAAIVEAKNRKEAAAKLRAVLKMQGLGKDVKAADMVEFVGGVVVLCDGQY